MKTMTLVKSGRKKIQETRHSILAPLWKFAGGGSSSGPTAINGQEDRVEVWDRARERFRLVNLRDRSDPLWSSAKAIHEQQLDLDAMYETELARVMREEFP